MMSEAERMRLIVALKEKNPFISSSAGDPWEGRHPNVASINKTAFDRIWSLVLRKAERPSEHFAAVVLGEAGEGKTHLIGRIFDAGRKGERPFSFAYIQPIEDPGRTFRYLLREIIANMCFPLHASTKTTTLDILLGFVFLEAFENCVGFHSQDKRERFLKTLREDPPRLFNETTKVDPRVMTIAEKMVADILSASCPRLPDAFLDVLFQYRFPRKRQAVVRWLRGGAVDDDDCRALSVPAFWNLSDAFLEHRARDILSGLGELMARYGRPIVICFDRLENLETDEQIHALGKMVEFLVDAAKAMLPLAFFRELQWEDRFKTRLNQHVASRMAANRISLEGCSPEQALDIVRSRLFSALGAHGHDPFFPFSRDALYDIFASGIQSPRRVITQANELLADLIGTPAVSAAHEDIADQLHEEFKSLYETLLADFDRFPPDRERLRRAMEFYLTHGGFRNSYRQAPATGSRTRDGKAPFRGKLAVKNGVSKDILFIIDAEQHYLAVGASLKRAMDFLDAFPSGKAVYIRDARCEIPALPRWPATHRLLDAFRKRGGVILFLNRRQASAWYALSLLGYAVKEADVMVTPPGDPPRAATLSDLAEFIRTSVGKRKVAAFADFDAALTGGGGETDKNPGFDPIDGRDEHLDILTQGG